MKLPALLREPLVHFLLIGLALFLLYGSVAGESADSGSIEVDRKQIEGMAQQFKAYWNRAPTPKELNGLIDASVTKCCTAKA